ncbi:MAG TPA: ABC transporter ATP-binding protein [Acidimicrobiales bacterium]|nr:ABC transporter ATP-binding protein [Acidimicrobiales bacterium]
MADTGHPVLELTGITKTFPGVVANRDVSFSLEQGEIHCLLGENGAGKSTLMNVVFGLYQPDSGTMRVNGREMAFSSSADAIAERIGMVHQHFQLVPTLSVLENVVLGAETVRHGVLDMDEPRAALERLSADYGLPIDPDALVGDLSVGIRQRVELLKALYRDADILILDEPTAVLTPGEVDEFLSTTRELVRSGKSVIFITHKLREVLAVADRITVLRGGEVVGSTVPGETDEAELASMMVGREVSFTVDRGESHPGEKVLSVRDLRVLDNRGVAMVEGCSFEVRAGEIFGIAGVEGNGQRELVEALAGMRPVDSGDLRLGGRSLVGLGPRQIAELAVGHIPEDRSRHGLIAPFAVSDNLVLNQYHRSPFSRRLVRNRIAVESHAAELVDKFDIRTPGISVPVGQLSGGNQQKVVVAREMSRPLKLLLVAQPTRGLDVGSIEFIHSQLVRMRDRGTAILLVSAELDEVLGLADTVGVLYRGRVVATMAAEEADRGRIGLLMASGVEAA